MNHRRVVFTPEYLADLRKGHADHISAEVHRNLSGNDDILASSGRKNVADGDIVESWDDLRYQLEGDHFLGTGKDDIF